MASIYCCKECGANLNLHTIHLYPPDFYFEAGNKGTLSFASIDSTKFRFEKEDKIKPFFETLNYWGIQRKRTKILCNTCGRLLGYIYDDGQPLTDGIGQFGFGPSQVVPRAPRPFVSSRTLLKCHVEFERWFFVFRFGLSHSMFQNQSRLAIRKCIHAIIVETDDPLDRYKISARLVVQSYKQEYDIDYKEVFSSMAKTLTVHTVLRVASTTRWPLHQIDVKNAFLCGHLKEYINQEPPPGEDYLDLVRHLFHGNAIGKIESPSFQQKLNIDLCIRIARVVWLRQLLADLGVLIGCLTKIKLMLHHMIRFDFSRMYLIYNRNSILSELSNHVSGCGRYPDV